VSNAFHSKFFLLIRKSATKEFVNQDKYFNQMVHVEIVKISLFQMLLRDNVSIRLVLPVNGSPGLANAFHVEHSNFFHKIKDNVKQLLVNPDKF